MNARAWLAVLVLLSIAACGGGGGSSPAPLVVTTLLDVDPPPAGELTLRAAIAQVNSGGRITFDSSLNGGTIDLVLVGETNSVLVGESFPMGQFAGYVERDYGPSALYAAKDLTIDASDLPDGIVLRWTGGEVNPARVLAVYGDVTLRNVTLTGGRSTAVATGDPFQPWTLARGAGLVTWGTAVLDRVTIAGNEAVGDADPSRDRGSFGGGVYGNRILLSDSVVSGNSVIGYGAAGGGVYSVGGEGMPTFGSRIERCAVTGNRVLGQHAYGGGVYSDGGGRGNSEILRILDSTIARNQVGDHPDIGEPPGSQYYFRGGGVYMSNGSLYLAGVTIAENEVTGHPAIFRGKPNMGGGGIAATIGDAHVVERMEIWHSIIAGNTLSGEAEDVYTGSLLHFFSRGYNLFGRIDASQMLVPIPPWWSLSRRHFPKVGDLAGVEAAEVLDLGGVLRSGWILSRGADEGESAVLSYPPTGPAVDRIPAGRYTSDAFLAQYVVRSGPDDPVPGLLLDHLRSVYEAELGSGFGATLPDPSGLWFYPIPDEWPGEPENAPWVEFFHALDAEIGDRLGAGGIGDDVWSGFHPDPGLVTMDVGVDTRQLALSERDQHGRGRPAGERGDVGAVER